MYEDRYNANNPPVNVGDEVDVVIEAIGEKGDGLARTKGFVLFVPDVKKGEHVRIKINKVLRKVGFAEVVGRLEEPKADDAQEPNVKEAEPEEELDIDESQMSEDFGEELDK